MLVPAVDGLRALAALTVVFYHVSYGSGRPPLGGGFIRNVFISGYMGVDFFFVISGFVLFLPTALAGGSFGNVRAYGVRRAARIIPAYYVALVAAILLVPLLTTTPVDLPFNSIGGVFSLLLHVTFLHHSVGLAVGQPEGFFVLGVVWTLTLEVIFYIVLPFVAGWYQRHPFIGLGAALVVSIAWRTAAVHVPFTISWLPGAEVPESFRLLLVTQFPTYVAHFAFGMTAAWLFVRLRDSQARWLPLGAFGVVVASGVAILWGMSVAGARDMAGTAGLYDHFTGTTVIAFCFAALLLGTILAPRWAQLPVRNVVARKLGDVSYGIYLWHLLFIGLAVTTLGFVAESTTGSFLRLLAFTIGASVVVAFVSFWLIEQPCIRWARRRSHSLERRRPKRPSAGAPDAPDAERVEASTPAG
ncbi:MAG TPA: acyltransferase [Acidimicrobiales bacterium]|nr:acyltransferase [Acidimicrobiales bacterium]